MTLLIFLGFAAPQRLDRGLCNSDDGDPEPNEDRRDDRADIRHACDGLGSRSGWRRCVRINGAHCSPSKITQLIKMVRTVDKRLDAGLGVIVDLQGPKIRVGPFADAEPIWLQAGMKMIISTEPGVVGEGR